MSITAREIWEKIQLLPIPSATFRYISITDESLLPSLVVLPIADEPVAVLGGVDPVTKASIVSRNLLVRISYRSMGDDPMDLLEAIVGVQGAIRGLIKAKNFIQSVQWGVSEFGEVPSVKGNVIEASTIGTIQYLTKE